MAADSQIRIRTDIRPSDIGYLVYLHGVLYENEYHLDHTFEGYVASGLGEFAKSYDERKDRLWLAEKDGLIVGSIAIVGLTNKTAQLRWFLVHPDARGVGLGRQLVQAALAFCRERSFESVFLWTLRGLPAAAHLYKEAGFERTEQKTHEIWGSIRTEERYDLTIHSTA
jgi:N-acetylglutamate synthase-like GNAT family acetyltransferase